MGKKVLSKEFLLENRESLLEDYYAMLPAHKRMKHLTKKERKVLGIGKDRGTATAKNVRIAPRKVKIVLDLVRGKNLNEAKAILQYTPKGASPILLKLFESAEANAVNNNELDPSSLYVAECYANQGLVYKRIIPRGKGSAARINKRTTNITVVLKERD